MRVVKALLLMVIVLLPGTITLTAQESLVIGNIAPDFEQTTLDGNTIRLSDYSGKVVVLNFFATWARPSRREAPDLQRIHEAYPADEVQMIGIAVHENKDPVHEYVDEFGFTFPILVDEDNFLADLFGLRFVPETYIIDPYGVIVAHFSGIAADLEETLDTMLMAPPQLPNAVTTSNGEEIFRYPDGWEVMVHCEMSHAISEVAEFYGCTEDLQSRLTLFVQPEGNSEANLQLVFPSDDETVRFAQTDVTLVEALDLFFDRVINPRTEYPEQIPITQYFLIDPIYGTILTMLISDTGVVPLPAYEVEVAGQPAAIVEVVDESQDEAVLLGILMLIDFGDGRVAHLSAFDLEGHFSELQLIVMTMADSIEVDPIYNTQ